MSDLIAQTIGILQVDGPRWQALATLDGDLLRRQPAAGEWSAQAERAVMQAFIPGSGPWRHYFADHDVEAKVAEASTPG